MKTRAQKIAEKVARQTDTKLVYTRNEGFMYVLRFEKIMPGGVMYFQQALSIESISLVLDDAIFVDTIAASINKIINEKHLDQ